MIYGIKRQDLNNLDIEYNYIRGLYPERNVGANF